MKRLTSSLVVCMLMLGTAACTANTETEEPPQTQEMTAEQQAQAVDDMTAPVVFLDIPCVFRRTVWQ